MAKGRTYKGTADADVLHGGKGDDTLIGRGGDDVLYGRGGNDYFQDGSGADELHGGKGDDSFTLFGGHNTIYGESGNDLIADSEGFDDIHGGSGFDTVIFSDVTYSPMTVDLRVGHMIDGFGHGESVASVESFVTGSRDDKIWGSSADETFRAGRGNDVLSGGDGSDLFVYGKVLQGPAQGLFDDLFRRIDTQRYQDTILDFKAGAAEAPVDRIDLRDYAAEFGPIVWVGNAVPTAARELGYSVVNGDTIVSLELDSKLPGGELTIKLAGVVALHESDFVLDASAAAHPAFEGMTVMRAGLMHPLEHTVLA